jgi:glucose-1-phosphate thymidylyltransferase
LSAAQQEAAASGLKGMMPIGRPFLDYTLSALADAGYREVCLVIGPGHQAVRDYYESLQLTRIDLRFAIQQQPRGTADAVAAAEAFAGAEQFLVLNSDNHYRPPR